jgi:uncharacterized protein involved in outer membrane biogenesis
METNGRTKRSRTLIRITVVVASVLVVYAIIGFLLAPGMVRSKAVEKVSQLTGQQVAIRQVKINPFALSVTIRGFSISDSSGQRCLGFEELYLNFELSSIFRRAYTFSELRIVQPYIHFAIRPGGRVNLMDLMPASAPADTTTKTKGNLPPLLLQKFAIERGQTVFEDLNRPTPFLSRIDSIDFSLRDFTTLPRQEGLYEFAASTERGESMHWSGSVSMVPLRSSGNIRLAGIKARTIWSYLQDQLKFEVTSGDIGMACDYVVDYSADSLQYQIRNGSFELSDLKLADRSNKSEPLQLGSLKLQDISVEQHNQAVAIGLIHSERGTFRTTMDSTGSMSLAELLKPKPSPANDTAKADTTPTQWKVRVGRLELKDYAVQLADQSTNPIANWNLAPIDFSLDSIRFGSPATMPLSLQVGVNQSGTFAVNGTVSVDPVAADLDMTVTHLPLPDFQPYVNRFARIDVKTGTLSSTGKIHFAKRGEANTFDFSGDMSSDSLRTTDRNVNQDLMRWQRLEFNQIVFHSSPQSLTIHEISALRPYARLVIAADRTTNIQSLMVDTSKSDTTPAKRQSVVSVGAITVSRGSLNFTDLSLTPDFTINIDSLSGAIKGLSSEEIARADVALKGRVDRYAPAEIVGQINPLSENAFTDITMKFQGIELTTFAPYAGKYAGYRIDKGKLSLDLHYKLSKRFLEASNHVVMDQLTLGEKVEGPDVTKLPVKLAIALLKDRHGVIDLDIPVSGDLNDPKFKVMPLILKILVNLATKAVTAPFALIGSLFGQGEDLSSVSFLPGLDSLDATQLPKLASLSRALTERPQLLLDIRGTASDSADSRVMAAAIVLKQIRGEVIGVDEKPLTTSEQETVRKLYTETFHLSPDSLVAPVDASGKKIGKQEYRSEVAAAAVHRLVSEYQVPEDALRDLARRRAASVKGYLILQGGIADARLMLQDVDIKAPVQDGRIVLPLALNAR